MNGVTYALAYSALVSYANHIAPVGTEGTLQGIVGATFTGIGRDIKIVNMYHLNEFLTFLK